MANVDAPKGLKPVKHLDGSPYNGAANLYFIPATDGTATFIGDAVKSAGSADSDGVATVAQVAAGDTIRGVVVGFMADGDNLANQYRVASTARYVWVADAPDLVFEIQDDSAAAAMAAVDIGLNCDLVVGSGSTTSGLSGMEIDESSKNTTSQQVRVLGLSRRPDNTIAANADWLVMINEHELKSTTGV